MDSSADATPGTVHHTRSADGTRIAYSREGSGPALVLVGGGLDDGVENAPLARALARDFTVVNYARRGRGGSGDGPSYSVDREIDDLAAIIETVGGSASLFGASSGGMFALEACAAGLPVDAVAVYEVPYDASEGSDARVRDYREQLESVLRAGRRDEAVRLFMRLAGVSDGDIASAETSPYWPGAVRLAHTLAYDAALYGPPPHARLATITQPVLVATGGSNEFFELSADAVASSLPNAERLVIDGAGHVADPAAMTPILSRHFLR